MDPKTKKQLTIAGVVVVVVLLVIVASFIFTQQRNQALEEEETRFSGTVEIDPVSGEEVIRTERDHDTLPGSITFLGLVQLIDRGLTMDQVTDTEEKFKEISDSLEEPFVEVSMYKDNLERILPSQSGKDYHQVNFKVRINQETDYAASLRYSNISNVKLTLENLETGEKYEA